MTRIVLLASVLALAGCSLWPFGHDKAKEEERNSSEQMLYRSAQTSLRSGNYRDAIEKLQKLEARFPFGRYAEQAQLELVYANFMSYQPEAVRSAADRFIRLHPQHPNVDYAYYLKGLSEFNRDRGLLDRFASTDISKRDPTSGAAVVRRFLRVAAAISGERIRRGRAPADDLSRRPARPIRNQRRELLRASWRLCRRGEPRTQRRRALLAVAIDRRGARASWSRPIGASGCPMRRMILCASLRSTNRAIRRSTRRALRVQPTGIRSRPIMAQHDVVWSDRPTRSPGADRDRHARSARCSDGAERSADGAATAGQPADQAPLG